jgi:hypothetical protein
LQWLEESVKTKFPLIYRGVGNWKNPQHVIILEKLQMPSKLGTDRFGDKGRLREHPYWELPVYKRLLPFMETKKILKSFYNLAYNSIHPSNTLITTVDKIWLNEGDSRDLFKDEMRVLNETGKIVNIICLGNAHRLVKDLIDIPLLNKCRELRYPDFFTSSHNLEWMEFRYEFWKLAHE